MTRALNRRMDKLEQAMAPKDNAWSGRSHQIISEPWEDGDAKVAALRASPEWREGDWITHWRIVDPPQRGGA